MNLVQFLKEIDTSVVEMSRKQLEVFIHELARTLPENYRNQFINTLITVKSNDNQDILISDSSLGDLTSEINEITSKLRSIIDEDLCLDSEYNVEYDDWYDPDDEQILFSDPLMLLPWIEKAIILIHKCVDMEEYQLGYELAELLSTFEISADGDYSSYDGTPLGIDKLDYYSLLNVSFNQFAKESLYLTYMGNELSERAEKLLTMIGKFDCFWVSFEDIMQIGNHELPELKEFLSLWFSYLSSQNDSRVQSLLQEALTLSDDDNLLLENARENVEPHPELYKQLLEKGSNNFDNEKMFEIGKEALDTIPANYTIRSEIALLTADYACRMNDSGASEYCWVEAFRSNTNVVNYMRIRFLAKNWQQYKNQILQILHDAYDRMKQKQQEDYNYFVRNKQKENILRNTDYFAILFFEEDFDSIFKHGMNDESTSNYFSNCIEEGIILLLMFLYKGVELSSGLNFMVTVAARTFDFTSKDYLNGTCIHLDKNDEELFWDLFCKWKKEVEIPEETAAQWLKQIERFVSTKVSTIMEFNKRHHYGECAAYIAALGEVKESLGIQNAKANLMNSYKKEYSRRRAFLQELKNYGMSKY